jgi:hypothetical protein
VGAQPTIDPTWPIGQEPTWATAQAVTAVAEDLAGEAAGTYCKEADIGIRCQSGQVFPR